MEKLHIFKGLKLCNVTSKKYKKRVDLGGLIVDFVRKTVKGVDK